jgi:DNA-binding PadR family transcriptional regulator
MTPFQQVETHFTSPPVHYLNHEQAIAYILHRLVGADTYGSGLTAELNQNSGLRISDTVLYKALNALVGSGIIASYTQEDRVGCGRPRRMFHLQPHWEPQAKAIAAQWVQWLSDWQLFVVRRQSACALESQP